MGRYYYGDIEGKFWFGLQSSDAPERFGCEACEPSTVTYYTEDKKFVEDEIEFIKENLGKYKEPMELFFKNNDSFNEEEVLDFLVDYFYKDKSEEEKIKEKDKINIIYLLREYADLQLGQKILDCLEKNNCCEFEAEY